ncbi:conserved oligomeric Golgi complex subunit 6 [Schistosoma bovis]|uniref:Conserved oligomeric Golgi complex subunit 6 n=1 Tax=Schistosoma bovis TaxID=6184 RepID=A0A430QKY2_SCHBO|nr:conserved oligomeric Golgi complex subunit 6 [Schistosoma bovis]
MSNNYISNRRTLRSNLEKLQLSYYQDLLASFGDVKKRLDSLDTCINSILETCLRMNGTLTSVKSETVCLVEEAQKLRSDSKVAEIKAYLLELLVGSYQISTEDAHILSSKISHIDDTFFSALLHGKEIKNICKELLQSNELTFSCSLMNEATEILDRAYENLYEWAQNECMKHVHETPEISPYLQRALSELQNKPVLLKYSLDEYANARRKASVKSFLDVLSVEIDSNSTVGNHSVGTIYTMHIREKPRDHVRIPDHPNLNLSPNELITDTLQLLIQMVGDQDISLLPNDEVKVERAEVDFNNYLSNPDKLCLPDINKLCSQQLRRLVRRRSADQIHSYYQSVHQAIMNVSQTCSESDTTVQLYTPQHVAELILNF